MDIARLMAQAGAITAGVVRGIREDQLTAPTPCADWDVRALINHLVLWSVDVSDLAARNEAPTDDTIDTERDYTRGRPWSEVLEAFQVGVQRPRLGRARRDGWGDLARRTVDAGRAHRWVARD